MIFLLVPAKRGLKMAWMVELPVKYASVLGARAARNFACQNPRLKKCDLTAYALGLETFADIPLLISRPSADVTSIKRPYGSLPILPSLP